MKMINGIVVVNKDPGYTSRDVVNIIGKALKTKKVGHTGTLDPLASGVLAVCVGRYTKLVELLTSMDKEYIAEIKLGIATDTLDITGEILEKQDFKISEDNIKKVFSEFIGEYEMEVPIFSAIKVKGKKLYEYARNKEEVMLPVKNVQIYELELLEYNNDIIRFRTKVQKGTYIRSLIRDICKNLHTVGTMNNLIRTKQGEFSIDAAYNIEDIKNNNFELKSIRDVLSIKEYELSANEYLQVKNGNEVNITCSDMYVLFVYKNEEVAIYRRDKISYKCYVMLKID